MEQKETEHGVFKVNMEEYYSENKGVIFYHWRLLIPGVINKWNTRKTDLKILPNIDYKKEKERDIINAIKMVVTILEEKLELIEIDH